jgi:hypothetical protein
MSGWDKHWIQQWMRSLRDPAFSSVEGVEAGWVEVTIEELAVRCPLSGDRTGKLNYLRELTRSATIRVLRDKLGQCRKLVTA